MDLYLEVSLESFRGFMCISSVVFLQISSVLLCSVDPTSAPEWLLSCCKSLCCADVPPSALLFLCQGTLTMLDWQEGRMGPSGEALLLNTVHVLFTLSSQ